MLEKQIKKVQNGDTVLALQPYSNVFFNTGSDLERLIKKTGRKLINFSENKYAQVGGVIAANILRGLYGLTELTSRTLETGMRGSSKQAKKYIDNTTTKEKILHLTTLASLAGGYTIPNKSEYSPEIEDKVIIAQKKPNKRIALTTEGKTVLEEPLSEEEIEKAIHERDSTLRSLKDDINYIDLNEQSVDDSVLNISREAFEEIDLETLMNVTNQKGLYQLFTFYDLKKPKQVDFEAAVDSMWSFKKTLLKDEYHAFADSLVESYSQKKAVKSSLKEYKEMVADDLENILNAFSVDEFTKGRNEDHRTFVKNIVENLDEDIFLAYSTTELFPNLNPAFNLTMYDKFLEKGGLDYIMRIPALYDNLLSFGPGQLTEFTISKDKSACSLNRYLPKDLKIPESMTEIDEIDEHIRGSIANMIYNTHYIASKMSEKNLENFNEIYSKMNSKDQKLLVAQLITGAHHKPADVAKKLDYFVDQCNKGKVDEKDILTGIQYDKGVDKYCKQGMATYLVLQNWE